MQKTEVTIVLNRDDKINNITKYTPVSILLGFYEVLEKLVNTILGYFLYNTNIISDFHFGQLIR